MSIGADDVRHLEALAALRLSAAERERMREHLQRILTYMEQLAAIDVDGVEPTSYGMAARNVLRPDVVQASLPAEAMLRNAPAARGQFYRVPRFVGDTEAGG
jgi:aspartyl-tRNA(Asn)/glutamyl-tRNA(Gln) amidotransferase subunit C